MKTNGQERTSFNSDDDDAAAKHIDKSLEGTAKSYVIIHVVERSDIE